MVTVFPSIPSDLLNAHGSIDLQILANGKSPLEDRHALLNRRQVQHLGLGIGSGSKAKFRHILQYQLDGGL